MLVSTILLAVLFMYIYLFSYACVVIYGERWWKFLYGSIVLFLCLLVCLIGASMYISCMLLLWCDNVFTYRSICPHYLSDFCLCHGGSNFCLCTYIYCWYHMTSKLFFPQAYLCVTYSVNTCIGTGKFWCPGRPFWC